MKDLQDRLSMIAGSAGATSAQQADTDLTRAKRALRRRRAVRGAGASVFAVAALAAVVSYGTNDQATTSPAQQAAPATAPARKPVVTTKLVAYQGEQPKGFTIDKVPAGWELQGASDTVLTFAPIGTKDKEINNFVGKIAVMLQSKDDKQTPAGTNITVAGKPGVINTPEGGGDSRNLWVKQPNGIWLQAQIWDASGWSTDEIVEFGAGLHVLEDAVQGVG
ncbi:hypothetical protein GCM10010172_45540 [Paractinoplanes ferrugineus]|uniref:Uncharacterized protein n=1 Tax=Paractinoplanes ferrugineus TaxID=113564 RepID=A0A919J6U8_9ACTN|nr:hypothetical protein [Actinoplanes ferrugineus]GIE15565.1 hypothetical protein Afe05nite_74050 [Actinoplanes ferrugineus]